MNIKHECLKNELSKLIDGEIAAFTITLQGSSHIEKAVPCQDCSDIIYLPDEGIVICAIADGVGSCSLSHFGAIIAVKSCIASLTEELKAICQPNGYLDHNQGDVILLCLKKAFTYAAEQVRIIAETNSSNEHEFSSTLTAVVYDGRNLYFGHVGDDGVVVQTDNGDIFMPTTKMQGEYASSMYPLQSPQERWEFGACGDNIAAFCMATDGVLDSFVDYGKIQHCNGIFYPFFEKESYEIATGNIDALNSVMERYNQFFQTTSFRKKVSDDITFVMVVNKALLVCSPNPHFDMVTWNEEKRARQETLRRLLYGEKYSQ